MAAGLCTARYGSAGTTILMCSVIKMHYVRSRLCFGFVFLSLQALSVGPLNWTPRIQSREYHFFLFMTGFNAWGSQYMTGNEAILQCLSWNNSVLLQRGAPFPQGWIQFYLNLKMPSVQDFYCVPCVRVWEILVESINSWRQLATNFLPRNLYWFFAGCCSVY